MVVNDPPFTVVSNDHQREDPARSALGFAQFPSPHHDGGLRSGRRDLDIRKVEPPHGIRVGISLPVSIQGALPTPPNLSARGEHQVIALGVSGHEALDVPSVPSCLLCLDHPSDRSVIGSVECIFCATRAR